MNANEHIRETYEYQNDRPIVTMEIFQSSPFTHLRIKNALRYMVVTGELRRTSPGVFRRNLNWNRELPKREGPKSEVTHWPINRMPITDTNDEGIPTYRAKCFGERKWASREWL